jgi:predicted dithiol-disulfide oxidoreductase (DUF899 family)
LLRWHPLSHPRGLYFNNRGDEQMGSAWNYLDITALGRQEAWEDSPTRPAGQKAS